ncbi:MAG: type IV toxin-antitoxin system AbiEi family antitoxin [Elusimicrobiota bacterium]
MNKNKNNIFENAIKEFKNNIDLPITIYELEKDQQVKAADKKIKIELHDFELIYNVVIKKVVNKAIVGQIKLKNKNLQHPNLIVTDYIAKEMAEKLKEKGIQFMDVAGNAYVNQFPLYIFIKGNKLKKKYKTPQPKRIFKTTGLRVLYNLLIKPELINRTYREIAEKLDVALGTVGWLMKDLDNLGFLVRVEDGKRKIIFNKKILTDWCTNYPDNLKPKLHLGNYEFIKDNNNWQEFTKNNGLWGGEPAAAKMTDYLRPEILTIYVDKKDLNKIIIDNRLNKEENGRIQFYEKFWDTTGNNKDTVNPLLVYADLLATGNDRNIETAKIIYEQHLKHFE